VVFVRNAAVMARDAGERGIAPCTFTKGTTGGRMCRFMKVS